MHNCKMEIGQHIMGLETRGAARINDVNGTMPVEAFVCIMSNPV